MSPHQNHLDLCLKLMTSSETHQSHSSLSWLKSLSAKTPQKGSHKKACETNREKRMLTPIGREKRKRKSILTAVSQGRFVWTKMTMYSLHHFFFQFVLFDATHHLHLKMRISFIPECNTSSSFSIQKSREIWSPLKWEREKNVFVIFSLVFLFSLSLSV